MYVKFIDPIRFISTVCSRVYSFKLIWNCKIIEKSDIAASTF